MKKALTVLAAAALLVMGVSSVWAATIQFTENVDPLNETANATLAQTNAAFTVGPVVTPEFGVATFTFTFAASVTPGLYAGALRNPQEPEPEKISDVGFVNTPTKQVWFFSDGFTGTSNVAGHIVNSYADAVALYNSTPGPFKFNAEDESNTEAIEIMDFNGAGTTVGTSHIDFLLFSPASEVPLPPTALLLGTGLLGLVAFRFRKNRA